MPFQVICMRNKIFWSKVVSAMSVFAFVIVAMAALFPLNKNSQAEADVAQTTYETSKTLDEQD